MITRDDVGVETPPPGKTDSEHAPPERIDTVICFSADGETLERLRHCEPLAHAVFAPAKTCRTSYYDTEAADLWETGRTLAVRKVGRLSAMVLCSALPGVPFSCLETEVLRAPVRPDIDLFDATTGARLHKCIGSRPLVIVFAEQFKRAIAHLDVGGARLEVAIESGGSLQAGADRQPFAELQLRLKRGDPLALLDLAVRLTACAPLRLETLSRGRRGALLASGRQPAPVLADALSMDPQATLDAAIAAVIGASLDHFTQNLPALDAGQPEAVHQARVALRRLRTALAQFGRVLPCPEITVFRAQAAALAGMLGMAREWDTAIAAIDACAPFTDSDGITALVGAAQARRHAAYAAADRILVGSDTSGFVLALHAFVRRRGWRNGLTAEDLPRLTQPASAFAAAEIQRLRKRVLRRGSNLLGAPPAERHEVRIAAKNLRYMGEFFQCLLAGTNAEELVRLATKLQTMLGAYNDAVDTVDLIRSLETECAGLAAARASGFVQGWFSRSAGSSEADLAGLWKRFRKATPN